MLCMWRLPKLISLLGILREILNAEPYVWNMLDKARYPIKWRGSSLYSEQTYMTCIAGKAKMLRCHTHTCIYIYLYVGVHMYIQIYVKYTFYSMVYMETPCFGNLPSRLRVRLDQASSFAEFELAPHKREGHTSGRNKS